MEKIPTIFDRGDQFKVINKPREGCEWVFNGEGIATEKVDGTNVRLTLRANKCVRVEKRRNPSKLQKKQGIIDAWYIDTDPHNTEDKWILDAVRNTNIRGWPDGEHSCEALGPKIQGNPLNLKDHRCLPFNLESEIYDSFPRDYNGIQELLKMLDSKYAPTCLAEGIVFHHLDGRRAKIKRKDFPLQ